jgi:hypothetical protein
MVISQSEGRCWVIQHLQYFLWLKSGKVMVIETAIILLKSHRESPTPPCQTRLGGVFAFVGTGVRDSLPPPSFFGLQGTEPQGSGARCRPPSSARPTGGKCRQCRRSRPHEAGKPRMAVIDYSTFRVQLNRKISAVTPDF